MTAVRTLALLMLAGAPAWAEPLQPAETPPPEFAGQQYRDSRGCLFVRAGTEAEVLWIPRVTRDGVQMCQTPVEGQLEPSEATAGQVRDEAAVEAQSGGYFVSVGSFAKAEGAEKMEARLAELNYPHVRGQVQSGDSPAITVFAGPYADAAAAEAALAALQAGGFADAVLIRP